MDKTELFNSLIYQLGSRLRLLEDKPEETVEATLKALWLKAAGQPVSAENAMALSLPNLTDKQSKNLTQLIEQRLSNMPLAHITGRQNFLGIELLSDNRALIPRKETEILGKKAVELSGMISQNKGRVNVLDICCGSGNLGIAVVYNNKKCRVFSSDISAEAVALTQDNINFLNFGKNINVRQSDLLSAFESSKYYGEADLIVCNPPYIQSSKVQKMDMEIAFFEPSLAFDGGMLGLKIIQRLIIEAPKFLTKKGWLVFEVGAGQGQFIVQLCERTKTFSKVESTLDNFNTIRVISVQK